MVYLYNICVWGNVRYMRIIPPPPKKNQTQNIIRWPKKAGKIWECGLRLAQIWSGVTEPNVGNKQPVTQTHSSHATPFVIHLSFWMKSNSSWPRLHMPSFLLRARRRQTHNPTHNASYQYNTHTLHHAWGIHINPLPLPTLFETMETFWSPLPYEESEHCSLLA